MVEAKFKQTEIGLIPEDWEVDILEKFTIRVGDGIHSTPIYSENDKYYFINGNNLVNGNIVLNVETKTVSEEQFKVHKRDLNSKTILLSINGTIGNISFYNNEPVILGKSACYINLKDNISKEYAYYILQSNLVQNYFFDNLTGSTIKNLGLGTIKSTKLPLPPLPEQQAIAEVLSDTDTWIESLEHLIAKKQLIKQGAMQKLLTPKEDWEVKILEEVVDILDNLRIPITESKREKGITPYYGANGIQDFVKGFTHNGDFVLVAEDGANDLLNYPINFTTGKIWVNNHAHVLQGKSTILETRFLSYLLRVIDFQSVLVGGTRAKLNKSVLEKIEISFPPISEQTRIATILSDMDAEIEALEQKMAKAKQIKQGLMQELLTGRVRLILNN